MPITERTLKKWRKEALKQINEGPLEGTMDAAVRYEVKTELSNRILRMTQILLDQHLIRKG